MYVEKCGGSLEEIYWKLRDFFLYLCRISRVHDMLLHPLPASPLDKPKGFHLVPAYISINLLMGWRVCRMWEVALTLQWSSNQMAGQFDYGKLLLRLSLIKARLEGLHLSSLETTAGLSVRWIIAGEWMAEWPEVVFQPSHLTSRGALVFMELLHFCLCPGLMSWSIGAECSFALQPWCLIHAVYPIVLTFKVRLKGCACLGGHHLPWRQQFTDRNWSPKNGLCMVIHCSWQSMGRVFYPTWGLSVGSSSRFKTPKTDDSFLWQVFPFRLGSQRSNLTPQVGQI